MHAQELGTVQDLTLCHHHLCRPQELQMPCPTFSTLHVPPHCDKVLLHSTLRHTLPTAERTGALQLQTPTFGRRLWSTNLSLSVANFTWSFCSRPPSKTEKFLKPDQVLTQASWRNLNAGDKPNGQASENLIFPPAGCL